MRFKVFLVAVLGALTAAGWLWLGPESEKNGVEDRSITERSTSSPAKKISAISSPSDTPSKDRAPAPEVRFHPESHPLAYRFELLATAQIDVDLLMSGSGTSSFGTGSRQSVQTSGRGELRLKFYPSGPGRWDVAGSIARLDYRNNGETPTWIDAVGYPFVFRMNSAGIVDQFEFTKGIPIVAQEFVRDILTTMQVVLPQAGKYAWETREIDTTGRYRAAYTLKSVDREQGRLELLKRKTDYLSTRMGLSPLQADLPPSRTLLEKSEGRILLSLDGNWLQKIHYVEASRTTSRGKEWSAGERTFSAERTELLGGWDFPESFAQFRTKLNSEEYLDAQAYSTDPALDRLGAGLSMEEAIGLYRGLINSEKEEERRLAEKFLVNYLRQHPMASFDLVYLLDTATESQIDDATKLILWRLLTEAGHREAQQALGQAASGQGYSALTQWRAIAYAHDFARPQSELVDELWKVHAASSQSDPELQEMALYALGSLGSKEDVSEDLGRRLQQQLTAELVGSTFGRDQAVALAAIGNTGAPEMIDAITPYLSSPDAGVRAAACDALRRMQDPVAADILINQYERETSAPVRVVAAKTLARLPANPDSVLWARQEVLQTQDPEAQVAMVRMLGESVKKFPENEIALRGLLEKNPARKVEKEIYRFIAPQ